MIFHMFLSMNEYQYIHRKTTYYLEMCQQIKFVFAYQYIIEPKQHFHLQILLFDFFAYHKYINELFYFYSCFDISLHTIYMYLNHHIQHHHFIFFDFYNFM